MIDIDIPFRIIQETIEYDKLTNTLKDNRIYSIPKPKMFRSPNYYIKEFWKYDKAEWRYKDFVVYSFLTGWHDADCRSYGICLMIRPYLKL